MSSPNTNPNVVLSADVQPYQQSMTAAHNSTNGLLADLDKLSKATDNIFKSAGRKLELFSAGSMAGIAAATASLANLDHQLRQVAASTALTGGTNIAVLDNNIRKLSTSIPVSTANLAQLATTINGMGVTGANSIASLTKTFAQLASVTGEDANQLAADLLQLNRSMGQGVSTIQNYASALATMSSKMGVSATSVTEFASAIQPMSKLMGLTETSILGVSGAFSKAGSDGGVAATAFNQILTIIQNDLQTGNPQIKQFADLLNMTSTGFKQFAQNNPAQMMDQLFGALNRQGPKALQILQSWGLDGPRALNAVQRVVQGGGLAEGINAAQQGFNNPNNLTKAAAASFDDLNSQLEKFGNTMKELAAGPFAVLERILTKAIELVNSFFSALVKISETPGIKQLIQAFGLIATAVAPLIGVVGAVVRLVPLLATLGVLWSTVFSRTGVSLVTGMRDAMTGLAASTGLQARTAALAEAGMKTPGLTQRGIYRAGSFLGGPFQMFYRGSGEGGETEAGPGFWSRVGGRGIRAARWGLQQTMVTPIQNLATGAAAFNQGGLRQVGMQAFDRPGYFMGSPEKWANFRQTTGAFFGGVANRITGADKQPQQLEMIDKTGKIVDSLGQKAEKAAEQLELFDKAGKVSTDATAVNTKETEANAEAKATETKAAAGIGPAATEATATLRELGAAALKASASLVAAGAGAAAGGAVRGLGALGGALGSQIAGMGPIGWATTAATVGFAGYEAYKTANQPLSQDQLNTELGTAVGNMNSFNTATGQATTSLQDLAKAASTPATPPAAIAAFSPQEIAQATDSAFKAVGYDAKSKSTTDEKVSQLVQAQLNSLSQPGAKAYTPAQEQGLREQLEHLLPAAQAKQIYDNLDKSTAGFTKASTDMATTFGVYANLGKSYQENINRSINPLVSPGNSKGAQKAASLIASLGLLNTQSEYAVPGSVDQLNATAALLAGVAGAASTAPKYPAKTGAGAGLIGGGGGQTTPPPAAIFKQLAKNLGLPSSYGNAASLPDFINKMFTSTNQNVVATRNRLFPGATAADVSTPQGLENYAQKLATTASQQAKAQAVTDFQSYRLNALPLQAGTPLAARVIGQLSGSESQIAGSTTQAVLGTATAINATSKNAADATRTLSNFFKVMGTGNPSALAFATALEQANEAMIEMNRSSMSLPQQVSSVASQMSQLDLTNDPTGLNAQRYNQLYQQQQQNLAAGAQQASQYLQQMDQFNLQRTRSDADYKLQVSRSDIQFNLSQTRAQTDFNTQTLYAQQDFQKQMLYSQQDYQVQRAHAQRDFDYQEGLYVKQVAQSLDPWSQVQAQSIADAQQVLANINQQNPMYQAAGQQLDALRKMGLSQNVIDVLGLSDPKNIQQLNRFYTDLAQNPQLVTSFNNAIKNRLDWTKGFATDKSSTQWQETEHQFQTAAGDAATQFDTAMTRSTDAFNLQQQRAEDQFHLQTTRASDDFHTQMANMATDYQTSTTRALQDINTFNSDAYGASQDVLQKAYDASQGNMKIYFGNLLAAYKQFVTGMGPVSDKALALAAGGSPNTGAGAPAAAGSKANPITTPGTTGINPQGQVGSYNAAGQFTPYKPGKGQSGTPDKSGLPYIAPKGQLPGKLPDSASPSDNKAWAKQYIQAKFGWGADEFGALLNLWNGESGWNQRAYNPSGASGIPQALPGEKMATVGADWKTNPSTQMIWGFGYIQGKYGDPISAWKFWQNPTSPPYNQNWYATGSIFNGPSNIGVGERGPEMVLPLNGQGADFILGLMQRMNEDAWSNRTSSKFSTALAPTIANTHVDSSTNFNGEITVQAQDPNAMAVALKNKAKLRALTQPDLTHAGM